MKAILISFLFLGFAASATTRHVLIYSEFNSASPDGSTYVGVFDDGAILTWQGEVDAPPANAKLLGKVEVSVVRGLQKRIAEIPQSLVLIDPGPRDPACSNTATSGYSVRKANGALVKISQTVGCHTSTPGDTSIAEYLNHVMAGVDGFSYLSDN